MTGDAVLVRALGPLAGAIPFVRAALADGALGAARAVTAAPNGPRPVFVPITRADGTPVGRRRPEAGHGDARCDLCHETIAAGHAHLIDVTDQALHCVCRACALLFTSKSAGRFRAVPDRYEQLDGDAESPWLTMDVPVGLAFFIRLQNGEVAACYPSPAGATRSALPPDSWEALVARTPRLATLEPEVEALLVRHLRGRREAFIVPVDVCYELVGIVRRDWRGLGGGPAVRSAIDGWFDRVQARSLAQSEGVSA
jgi:hypothetical protein